MGLLEMKVGHLYPISAPGLSPSRPVGRSCSLVPRCQAVVCHQPLAVFDDQRKHGSRDVTGHAVEDDADLLRFIAQRVGGTETHK